MGKITAAITGVGEYLPDYILTNEELSTMVDTSDEWIMSHIGVKTRHILKGEGVGSSYMGARAVINLLDKAGVDPMEIDLVICATVTPDMFFPSTGNLIADQAPPPYCWNPMKRDTAFWTRFSVRTVRASCSST